MRHLEALGVAEGWRCLDLSAGGGTVTRWLCERVGRHGEVVASDPDGVGPSGLERGRFHGPDAVYGEVHERSFDLVRARSILARAPEPAEVVKRMVACLKPGGWLLAEETDWISATPVTVFAAQSFIRFYRAALRHWSAGGYDPGLGRRLPAELEAAGLRDGAAEGRVFLLRGGSDDVEWLRLTLEQLRDRVVEPRSLSERQVDRALALLDDPDFTFMSPTVVAAWGRARP
jgi:SAM-dependent methyltransferase